LDGESYTSAWGGRRYRDLQDNEIQVVCLKVEVNWSEDKQWEFHVFVNGKSVAKSPWFGGMNRGWIYGKDYNEDGTIDYLTKPTNTGEEILAIEYTGILWESKDGPLVGNLFRDKEGEIIDPNQFNLKTDASSWNKLLYDKYCDDNNDGKVDVNVYNYKIGDRNAIKTYFKEDGLFRREVSLPDPFQPGKPENTPDDEYVSPAYDYLNFTDDYLNIGIVDWYSMRHIEMESHPATLLTTSTEEVTIHGSTFDVDFEITNGLPFSIESFEEGSNTIIKILFQPTTYTSTASISIPFTLIESIGYSAGHPAILSVNNKETAFIEGRTTLGEFELISITSTSMNLTTLTIEYQKETEEHLEECNPEGSCNPPSGFPVVACRLSDGENSDEITFQKCCCLLSCTWKIGLTDNCPGFCFSSQMKVREESKGLIPINEVQIGDRVEVDTKGTYQSIYSWAHYSPHKKSHYWQLTAQTLVLSSENNYRRSKNSEIVTLELSDDHMVFVMNNGNNSYTLHHNRDLRAIPASKVQLGNILHL